MTEPIRRRVIVRGDVQGVFFRDSTRRQALQRGLHGWVSNRPDGAVEAVFEGSAKEVEGAVDFCRSGPGRAGVERIEVSDEPPEGLTGFEIR